MSGVATEFSPHFKLTPHSKVYVRLKLSRVFLGEVFCDVVKYSIRKLYIKVWEDPLTCAIDNNHRTLTQNTRFMHLFSSRFIDFVVQTIL